MLFTGMASLCSIAVWSKKKDQQPVFLSSAYDHSNDVCHHQPDQKHEENGIWQLTRCNPKARDHCYYIEYIQHANKKQHGHCWLTVQHKHKEHWLALSVQNDKKSIWRLVSDNARDTTLHRVACYHDGSFAGWIGVDAHRQCNKLVDDIEKAVVYQFRKMHPKS